MSYAPRLSAASRIFPLAVAVTFAACGGTVAESSETVGSTRSALFEHRGADTDPDGYFTASVEAPRGRGVAERRVPSRAGRSHR